MSDIAMLVAEEYERRVKSVQKAGADAELNMVSCASLLALTRKLKEKIGPEIESRKLVKWVWEPKTQIAIAASNSFFSA